MKTHSTDTVDLSTLSPVEHDLLYVERLINQSKAYMELGLASYAPVNAYGRNIEVLTDEIDSWNGRRKTAHVTIDYRTEVIPTHIDEVERLEASTCERLFIEGVNPRYGTVDHIREEMERYTEARLTVEDARIAVDACETEYALRPWARFFLVTSSDGHIHSSMYCSTCNKGHNPTGFALVPYLSGSTAKDAVADLGSALCSVCFPDAPVEDREQIRISARVALTLAEQGVDAFLKARAKAEADAKKRASERCDGSGQVAVTDDRRYHRCPVCGYVQRSAGKVRAHRRPHWYAIKEVGYDRKYWDGSKWAPSTKKVDLLTRESAMAIVNAHGGDRAISD